MSLESTKTLFNMFNTKGSLLSDTKSVNLTDKTNNLKRGLAERELVLIKKYKKKKSST